MFLMFLFLYSFLSIMAAHNVCRRPAWMLSPPLLFGIKHLTTRAPSPNTPDCRCLWASASFCFHFLASAVTQLFFTMMLWWWEKHLRCMGFRQTHVPLELSWVRHWICASFVVDFDLWLLCVYGQQKIEFPCRKLTIPLSNYWYNHIQVQTFRLRPWPPQLLFHFAIRSTMLGTLLRRNMSQKLSVLLLVFGLAWGLMLLRYTVQQPRHQSSAELREQILELSRRYVKVLTEENQNTPGGPQGTSMAGYGKHLKRSEECLELLHTLFSAH